MVPRLRPRAPRSSSRTFSVSFCWLGAQCAASASVPRQAVAQKLPLPRPRYRALGRIDLELEPCSRNWVRLAMTRSRAFASDIDVAVVRIPAEGVAPAFQFPVQFGQQDVGQQRRQRPALRRAFRPRRTIPSAIMPASRYRRISCSTRPSPIFFASLLISRSWLTRSKNFSRSMSTTQRLPCATYWRAWPPPDARCAPVESRSSPPRSRLEDRWQHLMQRLLDQSIHHRRNAECAYPALRLRYVHPAYRLRLILARQQSGPDRRPVLLQVVFELGHREFIYSRRALVLDHPLIRELQVAAFHTASIKLVAANSAFVRVGSSRPPRRRQQPPPNSVRRPPRPPDLPGASAFIGCPCVPAAYLRLSCSALRLVLTPTMASADFCMPSRHLSMPVAQGSTARSPRV